MELTEAQVFLVSQANEESQDFKDLKAIPVKEETSLVLRESQVLGAIPDLLGDLEWMASMERRESPEKEEKIALTVLMVICKLLYP